MRPKYFLYPSHNSAYYVKTLQIIGFFLVRRFFLGPSLQFVGSLQDKTQGFGWQGYAYIGIHRCCRPDAPDLFILRYDVLLVYRCLRVAVKLPQHRGMFDVVHLIRRIGFRGDERVHYFGGP